MAVPHPRRQQIRVGTVRGPAIHAHGRGQKSAEIGAGPTGKFEMKGMDVLNGEVSATLELRTMITSWRAMAVDWGLTWSERRALLPGGGDELDRPPADTELRMRLLLEIGYRLRFETALALEEWLRRPTGEWGWLSPLDVMGGPLPGLRRIRRLADAGLIP